MNLNLDSRTLLLVAGTLYLLLPWSVWLVLRMPRQQAALVWCLGGMVGGLGLLLMGARDPWDHGLSDAVGQPLLALGAVLVAQSFQMDLGRAWPWRSVAVGAAACAAVLAGMFWWVDTDLLGRVSGGVNMGALLWLMWAAWQVGRAERSRNAMTLAWAYTVQAGGLMANWVGSLLGTSDISMAHSGPVGVGLSLLTLTVALVASMAYLGLALDRSELSHLSLARQRARTQQWQERREALVELDRERLLSVLADSLGHAITQPLTAALLRVETEIMPLKFGALDPQRLAQNMAHVVLELRRASETIERIRHFLRPAPTQGAPVDLTAVLRQVDLLLRQEAINRQIALHFPARMPPMWVLGDALQLAQAVLQLVRNAMDAVSDLAQRRVTVTLVATPEQVRLSVRDSGPGLPAEVLQREPDAVAPKAHSLQGIGLFVVESIARQHHGSLLLDNPPSLGAVVTLVLPCHHPHAASDESVPPPP